MICVLNSAVNDIQVWVGDRIFIHNQDYIKIAILHSQTFNDYQNINFH